ncbi:MAG TPA: response regulator transcription factor [Candidatus Obscuribacterales bacterium]
MAKILVVEDDVNLIFTLSEFLGSENHVVEVVKDGEEAVSRLSYFQYDLVVLDWNLPSTSVSGLDVLRQYRARGGKIPVLLLTGRSTISEKEVGLDSGADDYLTKPFHLKELAARIRALLRRPADTLPSNTLKVQNIELDPVSKKVTVNGARIHLLPRDYSLLEFFMRHPDQVFSNEALLERVWHSESEATAEALRSSLKRIRSKIMDVDCKLIENIPKVGYRLKSNAGD